MNNKKMNDVVLAELQKGGKTGGLQGIELIQGVVLAEEEWTPQNVSLKSAYILTYQGGANRLL